MSSSPGSRNERATYDAFNLIEEQMIKDIGEMLNRNQDRLLDLWNYLQDLSMRRLGSVPPTEFDEIGSLFHQFNHKRLKEASSVTDLMQLYCASTSQLVTFSRRAVQRLRVGCFWQASDPGAPSIAISNQGEHPRYLLRAQVKEMDAKCSYRPDVGITSAKFDPTEPDGLRMTTEEYRQHLRFHCNGWYKSRGPTSWISLSDNPSWIVDQIPQYGWRSTGHKIAVIDTQRLRDLAIPFARSSRLVREARLEQWRNSHNQANVMPWNVVKFATDSHWLVFAWIPAECIEWVDLEDFVSAHDLARRNSIYSPSAEQVLQEVQHVRKLACERDELRKRADSAIAMDRLRIASPDLSNRSAVHEAKPFQKEYVETIKSNNASTQTTIADLPSFAKPAEVSPLSDQIQYPEFAKEAVRHTVDRVLEVIQKVVGSEGLIAVINELSKEIGMGVQSKGTSTQTTTVVANPPVRLNAGSLSDRPPSRNGAKVRLPTTIPRTMEQDHAPQWTPVPFEQTTPSESPNRPQTDRNLDPHQSAAAPNTSTQRPTNAKPSNPNFRDTLNLSPTPTQVPHASAYAAPQLPKILPPLTDFLEASSSGLARVIEADEGKAIDLPTWSRLDAEPVLSIEEIFAKLEGMKL